MPLTFGPKSKWGKDRPWYWRFGHYACQCEAEFPNYHLRNAHEVRFHPSYNMKPMTYREGDLKVNVHTQVKVYTQTPGQRLWSYLVLCALGWWRLFTHDIWLWVERIREERLERLSLQREEDEELRRVITRTLTLIRASEGAVVRDIQNEGGVVEIQADSSSSVTGIHSNTKEGK